VLTWLEKKSTATRPDRVHVEGDFYHVYNRLKGSRGGTLALHTSIKNWPRDRDSGPALRGMQSAGKPLSNPAAAAVYYL